MDAPQQTVMQLTNCAQNVDYQNVIEALTGNAKTAYLAVITTFGTLALLITFQYAFLVFWHWKVPIEQRSGRGLAILIAYTIHAFTTYNLSALRQLGHITRLNFFYSLVSRTILTIILPLCFILPILSIPEEQRPYRRVGVFPAVFVGSTLIFSSIVVVLDRGVTYGESHTLEYLELAQACVMFVFHKRLRRVPFEGYWRAFRPSLFLTWLPPVQRFLIHSLPLPTPQIFVDVACSIVTVSEYKDGLCAVLVIFEALIFSSWFLMFSLRDKSVAADAETAESVEPDTNINEKGQSMTPGNAIDSQSKSAPTVSEEVKASLI